METVQVVTIQEIRVAGKQISRLDNTALKSIRHEGEDPAGWSIGWAGVNLFYGCPHLVLTVRRNNGARIHDGSTISAMAMAEDVETLG